MRYLTIAVILAAVVSTLPGLGNRDFWPPDEARYGGVAAEMLRDHSFAIPRLNAQTYNDKPPLFFWLAQGAAWFLGSVDETAARMPSVLGAIIVLLAVALAAGRATGPHAGLLAAWLLLAMPWFHWQSRYAQLDMLFSGLIAGGMLLGYLAIEERRRRLWLPAALMIGLAALVKGPLAPLAFLVLGLWKLMPRAGHGGTAEAPSLRPGEEQRTVHGGWIAAGAAALFVLPGAVWMLLAVRAEGLDYLKTLIGLHVVERAGRGLAHEQVWSYHLRKLPLLLLPSLLFLPVWLSPRVRLLVGTKGRRLAAFCLIWIVVYVALLSAVPGKRSIYLLTVFPAFAVLLGTAAAAATSPKATRGPRALATFAILLPGLLLLVLGGALLAAGFSAASQGRLVDALESLGRTEGLRRLGFLADLRAILPPAEGDWMQALRLTAMPALLGGLALMVLLVRRRLEAAVDVLGLALPLTALAISALVLPRFDALQSRRPLAEKARAAVGARDLAIYRQMDEGLLFYFGRPITKLAPDAAELGSLPAGAARAEVLDFERRIAEEKLAGWLSGGAERFCLIDAEDRAALKRLVAGSDYDLRFTERAGSSRHYDLLEGRPRAAPPEAPEDASGGGR